jgi:ABC-2 type transport system permease protein
MLSGPFNHFLLTLRLNFRSRRAIGYGYLMPVFFLVAFASVFRADSPILLPRMGQLLTICILGGACLGLPTALVAERERGIWRRYRLLPLPIWRLVLSSLAGRLVIVASAAALQIAVARLVYHTPLPAHPWQLIAAFFVVSISFLGLGLLIAALADDVPAVQALGQCLFLPMIMIGGVAVPLAILPSWAQTVAGFMPGRYAVEALQAGFGGLPDGTKTGFDFLALAVIGVAAGVAGAKLFRWESGRRPGGAAGLGLVTALLSWIAVGTTAVLTGHLATPPPVQAYAGIPDRLIDSVTYGDLPGDSELATPLAPPFTDSGKASGMDVFAAQLKSWPPGRLDDVGQCIRNLVCIAAIADLGEDLRESTIARAVFDYLEVTYPRDELRRGLAWVALYPNEGTVVTAVPEFGLPRPIDETLLRDRSALYARKFLGRVLGKIQDQPGPPK